MKRNDFKVEICANGVESCVAAQEGGANRVELCAGIPEGGTTPSYGEIKVARNVLKTTQLNVIIRPRGGDFLYTSRELDRMTIDIDVCKSLGVDGVVLGCLTPQGDIDVPACQRLLRHARGMSVTFHRAFDHCARPFEALEQIIELGFNRILTSGQQPNALQGAPLLKQLQEQAAGRIIIMAGCGVNEQNIATIHQIAHVTEFHFSARERVASGMSYRNASVYMGAPDADESSLLVTTAPRVSATIEALLNPTA